MILTGNEIIKEVDSGNINIKPFTTDSINPNSYNYRIGSKIKKFIGFNGQKSLFKEIKINKNGYVLEPHKMYLANTLEIIGSNKYAMSLVGRSSIGRLGLFLEVSANLGHTCANHRWTLELVAAKPIKIYPAMLIGQVSFWVNKGEILRYYDYGKFAFFGKLSIIITLVLKIFKNLV